MESGVITVDKTEYTDRSDKIHHKNGNLIISGRITAFSLTWNLTPASAFAIKLQI